MISAIMWNMTYSLDHRFQLQPNNDKHLWTPEVKWMNTTNKKKNTRHKDGETKQIWAHATNSCVQVNEWTWADLYIEFHLSVDLFVLCSFFIFFAFHFYFGNLFSSCCEFNYTFCGDCGLFEFCVRVRDVNNKNIEFSI